MNLKKPITRKKKLKAVALALGLLLLAAGLFFMRGFQEKKLATDKRNLPATTSLAVSPSVTLSVKEPVAPTIVPTELNLNVPFISQAPLFNWDEEHEEFCEEASILMSSKYFNKEPLGELDGVEQQLQNLKKWQIDNLGFFESTSIEETARIVREELGLKAQIIFNPSVDEIKAAVSQNKLVVVPVYGRGLKNPFFKQPGPVYHMLLIKGYTADQFITNDPGTKRGENYPYNIQTIMEANHDWNGSDVPNGKKVMLFVEK